jgi:hypothetical protein
MVSTSGISGTPSCPVFLIFCTTLSSLFTMPPCTLRIQLLLRLLVSAPPVAHQAIPQHSSLLPFSIVSRTSHTYAVRVGISFVVLMILFLPTSFEILSLLFVPSRVFPLGIHLFLFLFPFLLLDARMGGVGLSLVL